MNLRATLVGSFAAIGPSVWGAQSMADYAVNMSPRVIPASEGIYDLHVTILWICVVVGIAVFSAMIYSIIRHRKSKDAAASNFHESATIELVWTVIPFAILILLAIPAAKTLLSLDDRRSSHPRAAGGAANHGVLVVPPRPVDTAYRLLSPAGAALPADYLRGKWTLVTVGDANCGAVCVGNFSKMRQASLAQGENVRRVQRLFLITSVPGSGLPRTLKAYPRMEVAVLPRPEQRAFLVPFEIDAAEPSNAGRVYLVDPSGNLMMYYYPDADPSGMTQGLKRLLTISSVD